MKETYFVSWFKDDLWRVMELSTRDKADSLAERMVRERGCSVTVSKVEAVCCPTPRWIDKTT